MNTLIGYDLVPEAKIIDSALRACRRLNDLASAIRILEAVKVRLLPFAPQAATPRLAGRTCCRAETCRLFLTFLKTEVCLQDKAGPHKDIYPYLIQELKPTLSELGISTPEELGMDKL